ncbi:MAG: ferrous iron transport protein B [Myxococcales bacterium]|nr:ferrous iron transport protein B [Myxococcales bacterium]
MHSSFAPADAPCRFAPPTRAPSPSRRADVTDSTPHEDAIVERPLVALVGNPNTGKTTLFNRLTGARARVGNYPGVTVERRIGTLTFEDARFSQADVLDLPGTYSLTARSKEEQIAIESVLGTSSPPPALAVLVVDAGQLVRNLYLGLQLIELEVPLVVALNMMDEVTTPPDAEGLARLFGVPFVPIVARRGDGMEALTKTIAAALAAPPVGKVRPPYPQALLAEVEQLAQHSGVLALLGERHSPARAPIDALDLASPAGVDSDEATASARVAPCARVSAARLRALALWALGSIDEDDELTGIEPSLRRACLELRAASDRDVDAEIIGARYRFLDEHVAPLAATPATSDAVVEISESRRLTERVDRVALHPVWGFALFALLMLAVFQALFSWADPAITLIESLFGWLGASARATLPAGILTDLLVDGVLGGAGNVVVFLPQILLLFLALGLLEDSGYMARAAYLMDRIMKALGLHGRAFVPLLSGCACAIPAIMATRTMERERDRLLTMLVVPLMTCSARLPIYTLIIAALFPATQLFGFVPVQGLVMVGMYLLSMLFTLAAAGVLGRTVVRGRRMPLVLELPPYRLPTLRSLLRQMLGRAGLFLKEAGTVILACTIVLWALLSFPRLESARMTQDVASVAASSVAIANVAASPPNELASVPAIATATAALPASPICGTLQSALDEDARNGERARRLEHSYGGRLGKFIEPAIAPLGFDWKIGIGLLGAFAAREVFVSTMGLVYGIGDGADEESLPLRAKLKLEKRADGEPVYTPLTGLSLMLFFMLACQCMSTLAVVKRETRSWRWPAFLFAYMTALAYLTSLLVYQGGRLLGFA